MRHDRNQLGAQGVNANDLEYQGSRYADVKAAMFQNAYYLNWGAEGEPPLPEYDVTLGRTLRKLGSWFFKQAAQRTIRSGADLRWGEDGRGFRRLLHPNGVCLFGRWIIEQDNPYTGYFERGKHALIIARYSTCCTETRRGYYRSLSMVGKLYPTTDESHKQLLRTANFITQEDIGGDRTSYINDAELRNAPNVSPWRRGWGMPILLLTGVVFKAINSEPSIRQLHTIAELGKPTDQLTKCPQFMRLTVDTKQPRIEGSHLDFREEVLAQLYDRGSLKPTGRKLRFNIEVTDIGKRRGLLVQRWRFNDWSKIGHIEFDQAVASYNGDFVIHFNHPAWRTDRNDPNTTI